MADDISRVEQGTAAQDSDSLWLPDYFTAQAGSYTGMLAIGIGYQPFDYLRSDVSFGFVPESVGGTSIQSLAWKTNLRFCGFRDFYGVGSTLSTGLGLLYGFDRDLFLALPEKYPAGYYPPTAIRVLLSVAINLEVANQEEVFFDYSWHDSGVYRYLESDRFESLFELGTYGIGYRHFFQ